MQQSKCKVSFFVQYIYFLADKIRLDISCESSAKRIQMKHQALFSSKDKSKTINKKVVCCNFCLGL